MEKSQELRNVDLSGAARGVWLVKVPKYLSETWLNSTSNEVGKLRITKTKVAGGKPEVVFSLNNELMSTDAEISSGPKDHKFMLTGMANQTLALLSQEKNDAEGDVAEMIPGRLAVEGRIIQRAECRPPPGDSRYMQLKKRELEEKNKPTKQVIQLERAVNSYKPKSYQPGEWEERQRKKEKEKKSRLEKEQVNDLLFTAFEKHQYYNVKDLVRITQQPITFLKEVLKDICTYNMRAPHKNMWELKPEYRHYKGSEGKPSTS